MKKLTFLTILLSLGLLASAYDWDGIAVPAPGTWSLNSVSDDFNYNSTGGNRPAAFTNRWDDWYINGFSGPSMTFYHRDHIWHNGSQMAVQAHFDAANNLIYTGCISSHQAFQYPLYIEARVKFSGVFLANDIWMISADETQELDVCEAYPTDNPAWEWFDQRAHISHHVFIRSPWQDWQPTDDGAWHTRGTTWRGQYHRWGMYWESPWLIHYYVDGVHVRTTPRNMIDPNNYTGGTGLNKPEHIIINMEQQSWHTDAGRFPDQTDINDDAAGLNIMWVDWIRVYNRTSTGSSSGGSSSGGSSSGGSSSGGSSSGSGISASFANPSNNQSFSAPASVYVKVNASDNNGSISNVRLYLNNNFVRQENVTPYEWNASNQNDPSLKNMAAGNYTLRAEVTDNSGNKETITRNFSVTGSSSSSGGSSSGGSSSGGSSSGSCGVPYSSNGTTISNQTKTWSTGAINISCASSVNVSMKAKGVGPMESSDYLKIYYKLNDGSQVEMLNKTNSFSEQTVSKNNLSGNTLEIIVQGKTSYGDETYTVNNISISANGSSSSSGGSSSGCSGASLTVEAESFTNTSGTYNDGHVPLGANKTATTINWVNNGDWMDYSVNVPASGAYSVSYRISSPVTGSTIQITAGGSSITTTVPNNGQWDSYQTLNASGTLNLNAGNQTIRLMAGAQTWTWNLDKFTLTCAGKNADEIISTETTELSIYPNPVNDLLNVVLNGTLNEGAQLMVYQSTGSLVRTVVVDNSEFQLNTSELSNGMYILKVINGSEVISKTFFKN